MLTIKNINGMVMYNYHDKKNDMPCPYAPTLIPAFNQNKTNKLLKNKEHIIEYIADQYVEAAKSFYDENEKYCISFDPQIKKDILKWVYKSSQ